jgi:hypothetical protein
MNSMKNFGLAGWGSRGKTSRRTRLLPDLNKGGRLVTIMAMGTP